MRASPFYGLLLALICVIADRIGLRTLGRGWPRSRPAVRVHAGAHGHAGPAGPACRRTGGGPAGGRRGVRPDRRARSDDERLPRRQRAAPARRAAAGVDSGQRGALRGARSSGRDRRSHRRRVRSDRSRRSSRSGARRGSPGVCPSVRGSRRRARSSAGVTSNSIRPAAPSGSRSRACASISAAIAKGYILQQALRTLRARGVASALLEAGGDIVVGDAPPGRAGWRIDAPSCQRAVQRARRAPFQRGARDVRADGAVRRDRGRQLLPRDRPAHGPRRHQSRRRPRDCGGCGHGGCARHRAHDSGPRRRRCDLETLPRRASIESQLDNRIAKNRRSLQDLQNSGTVSTVSDPPKCRRNRSAAAP